MSTGSVWSEEEALAAQIDAELRALPVRNTPNERALRRKYSRQLRAAPADFMLGLALELVMRHGYRSFPYELLRYHHQAFESLGEAELEQLGRGINSWWSVDSFARTLAGPAWMRGQVGDELIHRWALSSDPWWRRAALVSSVAWNMRSQGGHGDVPRTLAVCRLLVDDHADMVVKAMSWALRELVVHDAQAVCDFLQEYEGRLAPRAKREVRSKLTTGLKYARRGRRREVRSE